MSVSVQGGGRFELETYVAVKVAGVAGAVTLCVWAPPSDQDENAKLPWGESAEIEFWDPMITVWVNGVVPVDGPTESCSPDGELWKVSGTVCGSRFSLAVLDKPELSVAVRWISR